MVLRHDSGFMKRKVMARVRSEKERELAKQLLDVTDDANGLIIGEIEEDQLSNARKSIPLCSLKQKPVAPRQVLGAAPAPPTAPTGPDFYKIELLQPFTERVKESLQKLGGRGCKRSR